MPLLMTVTASCPPTAAPIGILLVDDQPALLCGLQLLIDEEKPRMAVVGKGADPEAAKIAELTPKERQIVATVVKEKGARNKVIADKLHMSEHTLRNYLTTIYSKLEVEGRMELYLYATSQRQLMAAN